MAAQVAVSSSASEAGVQAAALPPQQAIIRRVAEIRVVAGQEALNEGCAADGGGWGGSG